MTRSASDAARVLRVNVGILSCYKRSVAGPIAEISVSWQGTWWTSPEWASLWCPISSWMRRDYNAAESGGLQQMSHFCIRRKIKFLNTTMMRAREANKDDLRVEAVATVKTEEQRRIRVRMWTRRLNIGGVVVILNSNLFSTTQLCAFCLMLISISCVRRYSKASWRCAWLIQLYISGRI